MAGGNRDVVIRAALEGGPEIAKSLKDLDAQLNKLAQTSGQKIGAGLSAIPDAANKSTEALKKTGDAAKLTAQQSTQLAYQLNDIAVQLAGGQNPFLVLLQQGSQITPLFGGVLNTLKQFAPALGGLAAVIGPALAALKAANIGNDAAKSISELGRAAAQAGLPVRQLQGYVGALAGKGLDQKEVVASFENLRKQAFASRDAWREAQKAFNERVAQASPGERFNIDPVKAPNDVFKKLGVDLRNFNGDVEELRRQLQVNFQKIGNDLQRNEYARLVREAFGRPLEELVKLAPGQVEKINAAFARIVPPLSQQQVNLADKVSAEADAIGKLYTDLGNQVSAAFLPVADAFNKFKLSVLTSGDNLDTFIGIARDASATAADFFKILSGDQAAKQSSPWVATYIETFKDIKDAILLVADAFSNTGGTISGFIDGAVASLKIELLGLEAIWLRLRKFGAGIFGGEFDKAIAENQQALQKASKALDDASKKFFGEDPLNKAPAAKNITGEQERALFADSQKKGKQATDAQNDSLRFQTQALNEATDATKKYTDAAAASNAERKRDPRLGNAGFGFGREAQFVNDPKANPDYYRSDAEFAAIAERQRLEMAARANAMRQEYLNSGGNAQNLNANEQLAIYQQAAQVTQQLSATTTEIATNSSASSQSWSAIQTSTAAVRDTLSGISPPDLSNLLAQLARASEYARTIANSINSSSPMPSSGAFQPSSTGFASGGFVSGPGTSTSDSIPAWLSSGEYVVRAAAVKRYGLGLLNAINGMAAPRRGLGFATGGLVPPSSVAMAGGSSGGRGLTLVLDGKSFGGMSGSNDAMDALERYAIARRISSTTKRTPSRVG